MERLKHWQNRRETYSKTMKVDDRKRLNLSNKLVKETNEDILKRRTLQEIELNERHKSMVEKVKLEKLNVVNRLDYLADRTF